MVLSLTIFSLDAYPCLYFLLPVWAATTKDADYIRMEGLKRAVNDASHRKEIVAGGMWEYMVSGRVFRHVFPITSDDCVEYRLAVQKLGNRAGDFNYLRLLKAREGFDISSLLQLPLRELPQVSHAHLHQLCCSRTCVFHFRLFSLCGPFNTLPPYLFPWPR